jgi:primosomal protein N'
MAASGEHERFYEEEVARRAELDYPPSAMLVAVEVSSTGMRAAATGSQAVAARLRTALKAGEQLLGPGPLSRERDRYLARLVVKTKQPRATLRAIPGVLGACRRDLGRGDRLLVDVDPQWM